MAGQLYYGPNLTCSLFFVNENGQELFTWLQLLSKTKADSLGVVVAQMYSKRKREPILEWTSQPANLQICLDEQKPNHFLEQKLHHTAHNI